MLSGGEGWNAYGGWGKGGSVNPKPYKATPPLSRKRLTSAREPSGVGRGLLNPEL